MELARLPAHVQECSMLYLPHLGYLLAVRAWRQDLAPTHKDLPNMKFMVRILSHLYTMSSSAETLST